jgi:hypothetical protein
MPGVGEGARQQIGVGGGEAEHDGLHAPGVVADRPRCQPGDAVSGARLLDDPQPQRGALKRPTQHAIRG